MEILGKVFIQQRYENIMITFKKLLESKTTVSKNKKAEFWLRKGAAPGRYYGKWEVQAEGVNLMLKEVVKTAPYPFPEDNILILITLSAKVGERVKSIFTIKLKGSDKRYSLVKGAGGEVVGYVEKNDDMDELFKEILRKNVLSEKDEIYVAVYMSS